MTFYRSMLTPETRTLATVIVTKVRICNRAGQTMPTSDPNDLSLRWCTTQGRCPQVFEVLQRSAMQAAYEAGNQTIEDLMKYIHYENDQWITSSI
ncbi:hypothetical protein CHS0354_034404 [Potamilus streckersoni]|uniref:Uncharacterized protein n=1 Tax=Potamilus streckersoni TaxID=2493646 RepID=A0AAE0S9G4_9BIVA|nr:hypothetical protein CHS0354_034404 [Potamilus streckersoni]